MPKQEIALSTITSWESFAAGYISGCTGLIVGHPFDSLKVLFQNSSLPASDTALKVSEKHIVAASAGPRFAMPLVDLRSSAVVQRHHLLTAELVRCIERRSRHQSTAAAGALEGIGARNKKRLFPGQRVSVRSLYNGICAPLVTVGLVQSVSFASYEAFRRALCAPSGGGDCTYRANDDPDIRCIALAAFASGALVSTVTGPLVCFKVQQQLTGRSLREVLGDAVRGPGKRCGVYVGYPAHFLCDSVGRAVFFASYEGIKARLVRNRQQRGEEKTENAFAATLAERMAAAAISGVASCMVVFPFDAVRTRMVGCGAHLSLGKVQSCLEVSKEMWRAEGVRAFTRGITVAVARSGPVSAVAMPVYDFALDFLNGR